MFELSVEENKELTQKQKQILEAAINIFAEKGYAASSTSEIAKQAGVAEGTIFRHYKTKKDLLISIVSPIMSRLVAPFVINDFKKVLHTNYETVEELLRAILFNRKAFAEKNLPIIKIMLQEIPFHPELKEQFMKHVASKVYTRLEYIVTHFQSQGQIIDMPASSIIRLIASSMISYLVTRFVIIPEADWDDEAEIERTIQYVMGGIGK
ncbi:TetR family transcriptional regulator [Halomonas sp. MG34]|nr:TetR family transcriptional regulator [Halomonas sp. MG34]